MKLLCLFIVKDTFIVINKIKAKALMKAQYMCNLDYDSTLYLYFSLYFLLIF